MIRRRSHRRIARITLILIIITIIYLYKSRRRERHYPIEKIKCYYMKNESLEDFSATNPSENSIYFLETSCNSQIEGKITITSRQACAVESAAKLNPNFEIYLLYVSPGTFKFEDTDSDRFLQVLMTYNNINIKHIDYENYLKDTIVENLSKEKKLKKSLYPIEHASDILRFLTLWKYGGIYLDLDTLVIKSLESLPLNYAGIESDIYIASSIISFSATGPGHDFALKCLRIIRDKFDGNHWSENGPQVITKLCRRLCHSATFDEMINKTCDGNFTVYPVKAFNPIPYWQWKWYFSKRRKKAVMERTNESYVLHMWNMLSMERKIHVIRDRVAYAAYAKEYCPKVWDESGEYF